LCLFFSHIHDPTQGKLDPRALKCIFVRYSPTHKGYNNYHPPSQKRFVSMDVTFFKLQPYFSSTYTSLRGESPSEEKLFMSSPLPIPATVSEHDKPLADESPTNESYEPLPMEELRVYSRRHKRVYSGDSLCYLSDN
jgi:hypothetical protein